MGTVYYYVEVTNTNNDVLFSKTAKVNSKIVAVTVKPIVDAETPTITKQPEGKNVKKGEDLELEVEATVSDGGKITYQLYRIDDNDHATKIGNPEENGKLKVPTNEQGTVYYYVEIINNNDKVNGNPMASVQSDSVAITVIADAEKPIITTHPEGTSVYRGAPSPELKVNANTIDGGEISYQWYRNTINSNTDGTPIDGATSESFKAPTDQVGTTYYYVVVTNTNLSVNGNTTASVTSNPAEIIVKRRSSGGSSGESSNDRSENDNTVIVIPPSFDNPNAPIQAEIKLPGTVNNDGNVNVTITDQIVNEIVDKALEVAKENGQEKNGISMRFRVGTSSNNVTQITINLPKSVQENIIEKKIAMTSVVVENPNIRMDMDLATIQEIYNQAKSDVAITISRMNNTKLSDEAKKLIGSRSIFKFTVNYSNNKQVQNVCKGNVTILIPYTLNQNEKAENVKAVYVDNNGKVQWLANSVYDSKQKTLHFNTNQFSIYGIGYKNNTYIEKYSLNNELDFVLSNGLVSTASILNLNPMNKLMFFTSLEKLMNSFIDSKQDSK